MGLLRRPYEVLQHKKEGGSINREYQRYYMVVVFIYTLRSLPPSGPHCNQIPIHIMVFIGTSRVNSGCMRSRYPVSEGQNLQTLPRFARGTNIHETCRRYLLKVVDTHESTNDLLVPRSSRPRPR